jgi:hypothetical protein
MSSGALQSVNGGDEAFRMPVGAELARLSGYPFEVRYSDGSRMRAAAAADLAADAYVYFSRLFSKTTPDIALIVADETDWPDGSNPYGLPFFNDEHGQIRPGILVMPAGGGEFWMAMAEQLREASPRGYKRLLQTYPDGAGGLDLQPFFELITIHELGHAFETLEDLRLPTAWLSEMFVNLAMHAFVATRLPARLPTLEVLPTVGAESRRLAARMHAEGYNTLDQAQAHYPGSEEPMSPLNYVWFQYRWQRLAAKTFDADGEAGLIRFWECFHSTARANASEAKAATLAPLLSTEVSPTLGRAVRAWR